MIENQDLKKRIVDLSYNNKLNHVGSCICTVDTIKEIYDEMSPNDKFVLSAGHAGLALYVVLENKTGSKDMAEKLLLSWGVHPQRDINEPKIIGNNIITTASRQFIHCSTGSLGQGLPIAIGMALADRTRTVYCVISDGECAEGSIWESLRLINDLEIPNIKVYVIMNGWGAYGAIDTEKLYHRLKAFWPGVKIRNTDGELKQIPVIGEIGNEAHYRVIDEDQYHKIMKVLNG